MKKLLIALLVVLLLAAGGVWFVKGMQMGTSAPKVEQGGSETVTLPTRQEEAQPQTEVTVGSVQLNGQTVPGDVRNLTLTAITREELNLLQELTKLEQVTVTGGETALLQSLREYCQSNGIAFQVELNGQKITTADTDLTAAHLTEAQAALLPLLPWLETLHLLEPEASAETVLALKEQLPETAVTWEKTVLGMTLDQSASRVDLTPVTALAEGETTGTKTAYDYCLEEPIMGTREEESTTVILLDAHPFPNKEAQTAGIIEEVEAAMAYFPEAEEVLLCGTWLDNEAMAQFRERHREDYKVVWSVMCGGLSPRTDTTFFMPTKYYTRAGGFNDIYSYNLHYCEEIVAMDIGHMRITNIDFFANMPHLKYLVLYNQPIFDLSPLASCKELVYLELYSCNYIEDYTPLQECTALEDLNIGNNTCDITPILEMGWLKNLWLVGYDTNSYQRAKAALPEVNIGYHYGNPDDGWRSLPNYFKMRDALLMFYME